MLLIVIMSRSEKFLDEALTGRTDVPTDGRTFPPLMLLGRLRGVDLIITITEMEFDNVHNTTDDANHIQSGRLMSTTIC